MRKGEFWIAYFLLLVAQLLISNYLNVSPFLTLSILPVMVVCISIRISTIGTMFIAMATGLTVDFLTEGVIGLNALALIPVAFMRKSTIRSLFGNELFARKEDFSIQRNGFAQVALLVLLAQALFLLVYIWVDGAGERSLQFSLIRFGVSLASGFLLSLLTLKSLASPTDYSSKRR